MVTFIISKFIILKSKQLNIMNFKKMIDTKFFNKN